MTASTPDGWHSVTTRPITFIADGRELWMVVDGRKRAIAGSRRDALPELRAGKICFPRGYRIDFTLATGAELGPAPPERGR